MSYTECTHKEKCYNYVSSFWTLDVPIESRHFSGPDHRPTEAHELQVTIK